MPWRRFKPITTFAVDRVAPAGRREPRPAVDFSHFSWILEAASSANLAMHDDGWIFRSQRTLPSVPQAGKQVLDDVLAALERLQWVQHDIFGVHLALEEALVNAIKHGNQGDASKQVHVDCRIAQDLFWVRICDEGRGFNPEDVPDPTDDDRLDVPSGRGIMLMRNFMSRVEYEERGTCVVMEKRRTAPAENPARA